MKTYCTDKCATNVALYMAKKQLYNGADLYYALFTGYLFDGDQSSGQDVRSQQ